MGVALSQDSTDAVALASMERLIIALMNGPRSSAGDILYDHLQSDQSFKRRLWKPLDGKHYEACTPNGTRGYHFLYQIYLRGMRQDFQRRDVFPELLTTEYLGEFCAYLEQLVQTYEESVNHAEAVAKVKKYLTWIRTPILERQGFRQEDWLGSDAARVFATPESPLSFVVYDPLLAFPRLLEDWGYVVWDSASTHSSTGFSLVQSEELVSRDNFGILTDAQFFPFLQPWILIRDLEEHCTV